MSNCASTYTVLGVGALIIMLQSAQLAMLNEQPIGIVDRALVLVAALFALWMFIEDHRRDTRSTAAEANPE